jgi:hypothetical protein
MRSLCPSLVALLLAAGVPACFSEDPLTETGTPGSSTGGGECMPGALGCDCYGNSTCDPMLECATPPGICVPAGCEPGQVHCQCDQESCDDPLLCVAGICAAPSDSSGDSEGSTASPDTSGGPSSSTATTIDSTDAEVTSEPSSTGSEESEGSSSETGPVVVCSDLDCNDCVLTCVVMDGQNCASAYDTCEGIPGCPGIAACMGSCGVTGVCLDECCAGETPAAIAAAQAVDDCRRDNCALACNDYSTASCIGG